MVKISDQDRWKREGADDTRHFVSSGAAWLHFRYVVMQVYIGWSLSRISPILRPHSAAWFVTENVRSYIPRLPGQDTGLMSAIIELKSVFLRSLMSGTGGGAPEWKGSCLVTELLSTGYAIRYLSFGRLESLREHQLSDHPGIRTAMGVYLMWRVTAEKLAVYFLSLTRFWIRPNGHKQDTAVDV